MVEAEGSEAIGKALADPQSLVWVDLLIDIEKDAAILSETFEFHPLTIEDCVSSRVDPPKIDDHGEYIFVIVHSLSRYVPGKELEPVEVDFYLGSNYVVSCHREEVPAIDQYRERCRKNGTALRRGPDWLLHGLLDALVDEYLPIVDALDDDLDRIEEQVLERPDNELLQAIMTVRRNSLRLRRATTPQRDLMNRLSRGEFNKLIRAEATVYYRDVYDHLLRIEYLVEALRDLADGALSTYLSVVSNRLNEVMKVLTAAAAIFLPVTLIAGIYGMNYPASGVWPPYDSEWGFGTVVGGIAFIVVALLAYFRYRNWL